MHMMALALQIFGSGLASETKHFGKSSWLIDV